MVVCNAKARRPAGGGAGKTLPGAVLKLMDARSRTGFWSGHFAVLEDRLTKDMWIIVTGKARDVFIGYEGDPEELVTLALAEGCAVRRVHLPMGARYPHGRRLRRERLHPRQVVTKN